MLPAPLVAIVIVTAIAMTACLAVPAIGDQGDVSGNDLVEQFSYGINPAVVEVDLVQTQIWDASTVAVPDSVETKYRQHGATVSVHGLDERSQAMHGRLTGRL